MSALPHIETLSECVVAIEVEEQKCYINQKTYEFTLWRPTKSTKSEYSEQEVKSEEKINCIKYGPKSNLEDVDDGVFAVVAEAR